MDRDIELPYEQHRNDETRQLAELYDADKRVRDALVRRLSAEVNIPHPIAGVDYADGRCPDGTAAQVRTPGWIKERNRRA